MVQLGQQSVDRVVLVPEVDVEVDIDFGVKLSLQDFPPEFKEFALSSEVNGIFSANGCYGCHSTASALGGLAMQEFPFTSARTDSLNEILESINTRIALEAAPMPPKPQEMLSSDDIATVVTWSEGANTPRVELDVTVKFAGLDTVVLTKSEDGSYVLSESSPIKGVVGATLSGELSVMANEATILNKDISWVVTLDGKWLVEETIQYEAPTVDIPIEVE